MDHVTTVWKPAFIPTEKRTYPYWSWVPCYVCEVMRPPRCHHCSLCQVCVLKRDHHCFFTGSCIGWRNQRHFLVFALWTVIACVYASVQSFFYFRSVLWQNMNWYDLCVPVGLLRWLTGYVSGRTVLCVVVQTLLSYFLLLTVGFANENVLLIYNGLTTFEVSSLKKTIELRDVRSISQKIRAVFGKYWLLNLFFPLHWLWEAEEDPEHWPSIKVHRH